MIAEICVKLFSLIVEYRKTLKKDENWAYSQRKALGSIIENISIEPIFVYEAKQRISNLFKK